MISKQSALKIEVFTTCQKQKNDPKLIFFNEKKIEKDSDNFLKNFESQKSGYFNRHLPNVR